MTKPVSKPGTGTEPHKPGNDIIVPAGPEGDMVGVEDII